MMTGTMSSEEHTPPTRQARIVLFSSVFGTLALIGTVLLERAFS